MDVRVDGHRVREMREQSFQSRAQFASVSGLSENTIAKIETGKREKIRLGTVQKLGNALGVHPKVLARPLGSSTASGSGVLGNLTDLTSGITRIARGVHVGGIPADPEESSGETPDGGQAVS